MSVTIAAVVKFMGLMSHEFALPFQVIICYFSLMAEVLETDF